jgi:hypothetical protein
MTWQIEHDTELGMSKTPAKPLPQKTGILKAILPGIGLPWIGALQCRGQDVVRHSALLQVEQRILKSPQTGQR